MDDTSITVKRALPACDTGLDAFRCGRVRQLDIDQPSPNKATAVRLPLTMSRRYATILGIEKILGGWGLSEISTRLAERLRRYATKSPRPDQFNAENDE